MPIVYRGNTARLVEECLVDEAGDLAEWLRAGPRRRIDLRRCSTIHTAIVQTLMALPCEIVALPIDPRIARWLGPALPAVPPRLPRRHAAALARSEETV
jgi:hypothetical protein